MSTVSTSRAVIEEADAWGDLQMWLEDNEDPLRPWNISAISRQVKMAQSTVRALLKGPKDSPGMARTAFTARRLRAFQRLFRKHGYRPLTATPLSLSNSKVPYCRLIGMEQVIRPYTFAG
jgi:hypothetical protein